MAQFPQFYFKGVQTKTSDLLMEDSELKEAVNVNLSKYGIIQKRAGYVQVGDTLETGKKVRGLMPYYKSDGTSQLIAATDSSDDADLHVQYRTTQNYATLQNISAESGTEIEGTNFIDYLFVVGYNPTDSTFLDTWCWDGSTYSTSTNLTNAPNGKYIDVVNGYLCIANGKDHNGNRATSRVWWADPPTSLPPSLTWDNDNNYWDFKPHDGEEITGIISNFNRLLVFKNTSFHVFDPVGQTSSNISNSIGCDSHRTIVNIDRFTIFFNRKGVYATTGGEPQLISEPVIKFIDAINQDNLGDICAGQRDNRYYHLFIGNVTVNGTNYVNTELVYDIMQNSWTVNELADKVYVYCNYIQPEVTTTTSVSTSSSSSSSTISTSSSSSSISSSTSSISSSSSSVSTSSSSSSSSSISSTSTSNTGTTSTTSSSVSSSSSSISVSSSSSISASSSSSSSSVSSSSSSSSVSSTSSSSSSSSSTSISQTTTTAWKSPTAESGVWTNPINAYSSDNNYADQYRTDSGTYAQDYTGFGFDIPAGSTIDGIEVRTEAYGDGAPTINLQLKYTGNVTTAKNQIWGTGEDIRTSGGSSDLWEYGSWTTDIINAAGFGVRLTHETTNYAWAYLDHVQIKIHYTTTS